MQILRSRDNSCKLVSKGSSALNPLGARPRGFPCLRAALDNKEVKLEIEGIRKSSFSKEILSMGSKTVSVESMTVIPAAFPILVATLPRLGKCEVLKSEDLIRFLKSASSQLLTKCFLSKDPCSFFLPEAAKESAISFPKMPLCPRIH